MKLIYESTYKTRTLASNELYHAAGATKHHKYIRKEKVNGKWRYYYKDSDTGGKYGKYTDKEGLNSYTIKKSNKLFSYTTEKTVTKLHENKKKTGINTVYHEGVLTRFINKGKKKVSNLLEKIETKKGTNKFLKKGAKLVSKLFKTKQTETNIPKDHKYIKRIKTSSGKYRYFYTQEEYDRYLTRQNYQKNEPEFMKGVPEIQDGYSTKASDISDINESWSAYDYDRSHNCANCSVAYELRCRGYDVQAADRGDNDEYLGAQSNYMSKIYENASTIPLNAKGKEDKLEDGLNKIGLSKRFGKYSYDADTVKNAINKYSGKNTRGEIQVRWKEGGGHSMAYEVNSKGEVTIIDAQVNRTFPLENLVYVVDRISITRTDNLKLKKNILNCVENNKTEEERVDKSAYKFITD